MTFMTFVWGAGGNVYMYGAPNSFTIQRKVILVLFAEEKFEGLLKVKMYLCSLFAMFGLSEIGSVCSQSVEKYAW